MDKEQGWAAEALLYSQINGSYSSQYGLIEQILAAARVQIRQQKESKRNMRKPHWLKKEKRTETDI